MNRDNAALLEILDRFEGRPVLVVGDLILDRFVWGKVERISPEAPVPVVEIQRETTHLGGAANVASNLRVLGARPILIGIVGQDEAGSTLLRELKRSDIDPAAVLSADRSTTVKTRIIAQHQQVCRTDWEDRRVTSADLRSRILASIADRLPEAVALVLSDYAKGVLLPEIIAETISQARRRDLFTAVDPKLENFSAYRRASLITPNKKEAERASGTPIRDEESLVQAGKKLLRLAECEAILITRGEEGMTLCREDGHAHIPTVAREVFDVTGAGDTVISMLTLAVSAGATLHQAAVLANHAAGVAVAKLGTAAVTVDEVRRSLSLGSPGRGLS